MRPDYHLVHTAIPKKLQKEQSRGFPRQSIWSLASFAKLVSNSDNVSSSAKSETFDPLSTKFTHGRLLCSQRLTTPPNRFKSLIVVEGDRGWKKQVLLFRPPAFLPKVRVSTVKGSTPACHCRSPLNLNSQHQPTTGRNKPTQGTSSMCP
jgi:hypothetical protein